MAPFTEPDRAGPSVIGVVAVTAITFALAVLILLMCLGFQMPHAEPAIPTAFKITNVVHTGLNGKTTRESYVVLQNIGKRAYRNRFLSVKLFVNDIESGISLPTLNGDASCGSQHYGVNTIGGQGSEGDMDKTTSQWYPDQMIWIDFSDGTFGPGDTIRIEVYDGLTGQILSRDTYPQQPGKYDAQWFYNYFLSPQAA